MQRHDFLFTFYCLEQILFLGYSDMQLSFILITSTKNYSINSLYLLLYSTNQWCGTLLLSCLVYDRSIKEKRITKHFHFLSSIIKHTNNRYNNGNTVNETSIRRNIFYCIAKEKSRIGTYKHLSAQFTLVNNTNIGIIWNLLVSLPFNLHEFLCNLNFYNKTTT